jgi:ketosteroid isomerase-like protein
MKRFFILVFLFVAFSTISSAQDKDHEQVTSLMGQQEKDWNRGDIDAFMEVYWKSEKLQFIGAKGITYGWEQTLANYKKAYPDQEAMGILHFEIKSIEKLSKKVIMLGGSWELEKESTNPGGHFLLVWKKIKGEWKIIADHTSVRK